MELYKICHVQSNYLRNRWRAPYAASVKIFGDVMFATDHKATVTGLANAGLVDVYKRTNETAQDWTYTQSFAEPDGAVVSNQFGATLTGDALTGRYLITAYAGSGVGVDSSCGYVGQIL